MGLTSPALTLGALVAGLLVFGHRLCHRLIEGDVAGHGGSEAPAQRAPVAPKQVGADGIAELVAESEQLLVGGVGFDPELGGDLGRCQAVAEMEIEEAGIALAQGSGGRPHQLLAVVDLEQGLDRRWSLRTQRLVVAIRDVAVSHGAHDVVSRGPAAPFPLEAGERPISW